jgi:hypothetical protein
VSPATSRPVVVVDPERSFGQPVFLHGGARVQDVLDRWRPGESLAEGAENFRCSFRGRRGHPPCGNPRRRLSSSWIAASGIALPTSFAAPAGRCELTRFKGVQGERDEAVADVEWLGYFGRDGRQVLGERRPPFATGQPRFRRSAASTSERSFARAAASPPQSRRHGSSGAASGSKKPVPQPVSSSTRSRPSRYQESSRDARESSRINCSTTRRCARLRSSRPSSAQVWCSRLSRRWRRGGVLWAHKRPNCLKRATRLSMLPAERDHRKSNLSTSGPFATEEEEARHDRNRDTERSQTDRLDRAR